MTFFRILWVFDALIALVVLYFFAEGLADGSVSSMNAGLWALLVLGVGGVLWGGWQLNVNQRPGLAKAVLLLLAVPGFFALLFVLVLLIAQPRWN